MEKQLNCVVFSLLLLTGCGECRHPSVTEADCLHPGICERCGAAVGEKGGHTTHTGKCAVCGEYDLSELYLPDQSTFSGFIERSDVENGAYQIIGREQYELGQVLVVDLPEEQRLSNITKCDWRLYYQQFETAEMLNCELLCWYMANEADVMPAYEAIRARYEAQYGAPKKENFYSDWDVCANWYLNNDRNSLLIVAGKDFVLITNEQS